MQMEKRYTEWITIWNANCDATKSKKKSELIRELEAWERVQSGKGQGSNYGKQIREKDFDGKGWSTTHDDSFKDLIAKARHGRAAKAQASETASAPTESLGTPLPAAPADLVPAPIQSDTEMAEISKTQFDSPPIDPEGQS